MTPSRAAARRPRPPAPQTRGARHGHRPAFGFVVHGPAPLASLARAYGLEVFEAEGRLSAGELLARAHGGAARVGDRAAWGPAKLVVRTLGGDGLAETVGPPWSRRPGLHLERSAG